MRDSHKLIGYTAFGSSIFEETDPPPASVPRGCRRVNAEGNRPKSAVANLPCHRRLRTKLDSKLNRTIFKALVLGVDPDTPDQIAACLGSSLKTVLANAELMRALLTVVALTEGSALWMMPRLENDAVRVAFMDEVNRIRTLNGKFTPEIAYNLADYAVGLTGRRTERPAAE